MNEQEDKRRYYRLLAQYSSIVFILPSAVIGTYLVGRWLDNRYDSSPWLTSLLVLLGSVAGFIEVFRILNRKS
jgi:F0F1-type ATP synthase assembly protein I